MKKIVGIITRPNLDFYQIKREVSDVILEYGCLPLAIIPPNDEGTLCESFKEDIKQLLDLCDGFILQGGSDYYEYDLEITKYLYENDIPVLGICLGMQTMAVMRNGKLDNIGDLSHQSNIDYVHAINIKKDSRLYEILNKEVILVNSRHKDKVLSTKLSIAATSDSIIEAVEDSNKKFFIGVQWHPETIYFDDNSRCLFNAFFNSL